MPPGMFDRIAHKDYGGIEIMDIKQALYDEIGRASCRERVCLSV